MKKLNMFSEMLFDAEATRKSIPPLTEADGSLSIDDAYAIQLDNVSRATAMGHVISGKKIGLTSSGIQQQFGVSEPDYGHLFRSMECPGGDVDTARLMQPKIEGELAFVLQSDLTGGKVTPEDVLNATEYVAAAFEIVDSRIADWRIKLPDTIADNASSGRYILGDVRLSPKELDLPGIKMQLYKNGEKIGEGAGAAVLGNPCNAVAWLANRLWSYGVALKAGEVILSGAFSAAPEAHAGDSFEAVFTSLGSVKARFI